MRRLRDYSLCLCLLLLWPLAVNADDSWRQIQTEAHGQTVWFNAWGGDPAVNRYLAGCGPQGPQGRGKPVHA